MKNIPAKEIKIGSKVMICDRQTVGGRDYLVYEPAVIEKDYRGADDFDGSFLARLEHNGKSYGVHLGQIFERLFDKSVLILPE